MSTVTLVPVQASVFPQTYVFFGFGTRGEVLIVVHDVEFSIQVMDLRSTLGSIDLIMISWMTEGGLAWVAITDNAEFSESWFGMDVPAPTIIVCKRDLDVWSWFRTLIVVLRVPVDVSDGLTIHPFTLKLRSHGCGEWIEETVSNYPGYTINMRSKTYEATATIAGPDYCDLSIEDARVNHRVKIRVTAP